MEKTSRDVAGKVRRNETGYTCIPFAKFRHQMIDWLGLMHRRHTVHGLLEVDVTDARRAIRDYRARTGEPLSFTAFIVASLARAVAEDKVMHAYRKGRGQLVLFDDVDVAVLVERELEGEKVPIGIVIRAADKKALRDIQRDIRIAQTGPPPQSHLLRWLALWRLVPATIRRVVWTAYLSGPQRRKRLLGTVAVTAIGMFGNGTGWGIPLTNHTLCLTVGGIDRKPGVVRERRGRRDEHIEAREYLSLTISMDHDVIDGAPAARFATRLKNHIESGVVLGEGPVHDEYPDPRRQPDQPAAPADGQRVKGENRLPRHPHGRITCASIIRAKGQRLPDGCRIAQ